jgi:hypothetical protein
MSCEYLRRSDLWDGDGNEHAGDAWIDAVGGDGRH